MQRRRRMDWKTWRRPTLPCLEAQYHGRWGFSRPSSGWDRVRAPRQSHQVIQSLCLAPGIRADGLRTRLRWAEGGNVVLVRVICVLRVLCDPRDG